MIARSSGSQKAPTDGGHRSLVLGVAGGTPEMTDDICVVASFFEAPDQLRQDW